MEDDDEFGDLYTDVLLPFPYLSSAPKPQELSPAPASNRRPIDLNLQTDNNADDNAEILYGAPHRDLTANSNQMLENSAKYSIPNGDNSTGGPRVLGTLNAKLRNNDSNTIDLSGFQSGKLDEEVKLDIEEANTGIIEDSGGMIPGLAVNGGDSGRNEADVNSGQGVREGDEGWDEESDSEDGLHIVLNDTNHGPMGMERGVMDDGAENDDDGSHLISVADGDPNQEMEEQNWGAGDSAAAAGAEEEKKEGGEAVGKSNAVAGPKIGYSNHGYHQPFHSQFKYVRPGAAPIPGVITVGPGGTPSQVRAPISSGPMTGHGRGEWRPPGKNVPMQKNYHTTFGTPAWSNNMVARGFGGGLEFTLPSYKTIFDVDIDSFEEKPWKYPGIDMSDFFNFSLNEDSWKDYCKQLEQHRLETTMQSKIRVYESGRAEQEYDPDLPPELAAAVGMQDVPADNSNLGKPDVGQSDLTKGSARARPPLPTGRAIQVEGGYGERLPSIDTRPPRIRDSDAIIEIVLQDSVDDDSTAGNGALDGANNDALRDDVKGSHAAEYDMTPIENEYSDDFSQAYNRKSGRKTPLMDSVQHNVPEGDEISAHPEAQAQYHPRSRGQPSMCPGDDFGNSDEERWTQGRTHESSPHLTPTRSAGDRRFLDNADEKSVKQMDGKHCLRDAMELSVDNKDDAVPDELVQAEGSSGMEKDEMTENTVTTNDILKDGNTYHSMKKQKINSFVEQPGLQDFDDREHSKAARSSENSKARSGSSKDYQKWQDGLEEEEVQDGRSRRMGSIKRHHDESQQKFRRKDRDVLKEMERNHPAKKGRDCSYPCRDLDPSLAHHLHMKNEGYDRRKEHKNPDGSWQRRDDDPHSRKHRTEDTRKRECGDEIGSTNGSKTWESERSEKDEHLHSRKQLDNGSYRPHYEKDGSSWHREREDNMKSRHEVVDDYHGKRRKDIEYLRRDHTDKEEGLHGLRENTNRRRRERDDGLEPRKRVDQQRTRDSFDDYYSARHNDELWPQRETGERLREREELYRLKPSYEENILKRERQEGRTPPRSGRGTDDKAWIGHARLKDEYRGSDKEYQLKDANRNCEQQKRRNRMEDGSFSHRRSRDDINERGNQFSNEEIRSRLERSGTQIDHAVDTSDNHKVNEKKHKENTRKSKESLGGDHSTSGTSRRSQKDQGLKGTGEQRNGENEVPVQRSSSKRHREEASSDDEQVDSRRGRSKLERWTSHKERDYSIGGKSSASLKFQEIDRNNTGRPSEAGKLPNEPPKRAEAVEKHSPGKEKDADDTENNDTNTKTLEDRHLDTVEKLKKRSERFKLPMPGEKDALAAVKKMENEALPSVKTETPTDSEFKPERPPRKRRWIGN